MENFNNLVTQWKNWLKKYSPEILLKWIQSCAIHPGNQRFQLRFELLLAIIISIENDDFEYEELDYKSFKDFMTDFKEKTNQVAIEDYYIYDQLKLIPYFHDRRKYFFFYGISERPYESLRILDWIFLLPRSSDSIELSLIQRLFIQILNFQTNLLINLREEIEKLNCIDNEFQIPNQEFLEKFSEYFIINSSPLDENLVLRQGELSLNIDEDIRKIIIGDFFKHLYIKTTKELFIILPQLHIEILLKTFQEIIKISADFENLTARITNNLLSRFRLLCGRFFSTQSFVIAIGNKTESFSENIDLMVFFENFLLLFKLANPLSSSLSKEINEINNLFEQCVAKIQNEKEIFLFLNENQYYKIQTEELRIIKINVFESLKSGFTQIDLDFRTNFLNQLFSIKDLIAMLEILPSKYSFIKYLQERDQYRSKIFNINGINILAAFLMNNESIPDFGEDVLSLDPNFWVDYYTNYLFDKFSDSIYELVEKDYPYKYNLVKKWNEEQELFECIDTFTLQGANIIKNEENLIWIINPPQHENLNIDDFRFAMQVIGPMYADYLQRILNPFKELLSTYTSYNLHGLFLIPLKMCKNNPNVEKFKEYWNKVDQDDPIIVKSFVNTKLELISLVFYDFELWCEKFKDSPINDNCKYAIFQFLRSIIELFDVGIEDKEKEDFINRFLYKHFRDGDKDYLAIESPVWNPKIIQYPPHQKVNLGDLEMVIKHVEAFFREKLIKKKIYTPEESKKIYNDVYRFLYEKFQERTSSYDISLLLKAYDELELIEAKRYKLLMETGMKSDNLLDDRYIDYFRKEMGEIMNLSSSTRFHIENLLNFGLAGMKKIDSIDYGFIQALVNYLVIISQRSDFTHSEVIDNMIEIKDHYQFDEIQESTTFDYDKYIDSEFNIKIKLSRSLLESEINQNKSNKNSNLDENEKKLVNKLEKAFLKEFGFTFTQIMRVLFILSTGKFENKNKDHFPIIKIKIKDLIDEIQNEYKIQFEGVKSLNDFDSGLLTQIIIRNIVNFLSLDFNSYKEDKILFQLNLLKRKERLTICPLIRLNDEELIFGQECSRVSFNLWRHFVLSGVFPFPIKPESLLSKALANLHSYRDKGFEDLCGGIVRDTLGKENSILRLKKFNIISENLPKSPECGEIDLLAANPERKIIFVLDAKNYYLKLHPYDIKNQIKKFLTKESSDYIKLKKKEEFVLENINLFLDYFKIEDKSDWQIKKGFVVKHNFPSLHIPDYNVDFILEKELKKYLRNNE
jgi:hypothetical protein